MRILIVHNQLWAHYKSKLFEEIHANLSERYPEAEFKVAQIGLFESARKEMQSSQENLFDYPYEVLFQKSLDQISFSDRLKALFKVFSKFKPDVLNITGYYDWAQILLLFYAKMIGVKVVLSSESSVFDHQRSRLKEHIKSLIVNRADAFFCFGTTSVEYLTKLRAPLSKIKVSNAAVIDDQKIVSVFNQANTGVSGIPPNFIFVGRFSEEKNLPTLLKAYKEVRKRSTNPWGLFLVGDGPVRPKLEELIRVEKIDGVFFSGGVPWFDVPLWLAKSSVLILPSYSEPWGLVVNEALVCGRPVIVSEKCGCVKDLVIPGKTGHTFAPDNVGELIKHMLYFMSIPESEYNAFSLAGKAVVSQFAASKVAGEMVDTFVSMGHNKRS